MNNLRRLALLALCLLPAAAWAVPIRFAAEGVGAFSFRQAATPLPGGGFAVVWSWWDGRSHAPEDMDVRLQLIRPDGSLVFPRAGRQVAATGWWEDQPAVAPHPEDGVFVAYRRLDLTGNRVRVQRYDGAGQPLWPEPVIVAPVNGLQHQGEPSLLPDADGGVYACFNSGPAMGALQVPTEVVCQHLDAAGRRLWPDPGVRPGGTHGLRGAAQMRPDGEGGILVFWRNERKADGELGPVLFEGQRLAADGSRLWGPRGRVVARSRLLRHGNFVDPWYKAVPDGEGGAVLAFQDQTGFNYQSQIVRAQRVDGEGRLLWGSGVTAGPLQRRQVLADAVAGPDGGVFVIVIEGEIRLSVYRLDAEGTTVRRTPVSRGDQTFASVAVHGDFDGELLRIVWESHPQLGVDRAEIRLSTFDAEGRAVGAAEVLSPLGDLKHPVDLVYDPILGQGLAVWNAGRRAVGVLFQ